MTTVPLHVAGARQMGVAADVRSRAVFGGPGDCYRYLLIRTWDASLPNVFWLMMNPSVATEDEDDRTVAKCQRFARRWGFGGIVVGNSMAYRCTDQARLTEVEDPIGPDNYTILHQAARQCASHIAAYGTPKIPALRNAGMDALHAIDLPFSALRVSEAGRPWHPLYLPETASPAPFYEPAGTREI